MPVTLLLGPANDGMFPAETVAMRLPDFRMLVLLALFLPLAIARAQEAVSSIEQARLFQSTPKTSDATVNADGMALPASEGDATDDSFGAQMILKNQPRVRTFVLAGDASLFYTDNVALTRRDRRGDAFFVGHAAASWTPRLSPTVEAQIGAAASVFRYHRTSELDFTSLTAGAGLSWAPTNFGGVSLFARYDFIELLNRQSSEILQDHEFTVGAQRTFALGRSHSIVVGGTGMFGISTPDAAQRNQTGLFIGYHLQVTRAFGADLFYRPAFYYYGEADRRDFNQTVSFNLRYQLTPWADANGFLAFTDNRSNRSVFDYEVVSTGAGLGVTVRF